MADVVGTTATIEYVAAMKPIRDALGIDGWWKGVCTVTPDGTGGEARASMVEPDSPTVKPVRAYQVRTLVPTHASDPTATAPSRFITIIVRGKVGIQVSGSQIPWSEAINAYFDSTAHPLSTFGYLCLPSSPVGGTLGTMAKRLGWIAPIDNQAIQFEIRIVKSNAANTGGAATLYAAGFYKDLVPGQVLPVER